jgi:hypothetical protein
MTALRGPRHLEDCAMEDTLRYPRELIAARVVFTPADHAQIALCRGAHNRLGFAYQMAFLRLTGRFPNQQPLELLPDVLAFVASELALAPTVIETYAQRQATVSAHQEQIRLHLGFRALGLVEREALSHFLREEALHLDHLAALVAQAEAFLRDHQILLPALSTLRRLAGEQRDWSRQLVAARMMALLPPDLPARLDALLQVEADHRLSPLHALKTPPGMPTPQAVSRLTAKLDCIQATGVLALDLTWLNNNLQKALARHAAQASVQRLRLLDAPQRYTVLVCFLMQTYHETLDQLVEMYDKLVTATYQRAQRRLDEAVKRQRRMLRATLESFHTIGQTLFNEQVPPEAVRATVFQQIPSERLQAQLTEAQQWLSGDTSAVFPLVMKRYSYLRQFAPILRDLNTTGQRTLPEELPMTCLPKRLRAFVGTNGTTNRRAYECAVLTTLRDEIKRGNVWIRGSTRFGKLDDFFLPDAAWAIRRQDFFRKAGLPADSVAAATWLTTRLNAAYDRFLAALPANTSVTIDKEGWHLATDPAEALSPADEAGLATLRVWLRDKIPTIRLPELLIAVDNDLDWTRHFLPRGRRDTRTADEVCQVIATIMAYGCNLGPARPWRNSPSASATRTSSGLPTGICMTRPSGRLLPISSMRCWRSIPRKCGAMGPPPAAMGNAFSSRSGSCGGPTATVWAILPWSSTRSLLTTTRRSTLCPLSARRVMPRMFSTACSIMSPIWIRRNTIRIHTAISN